MASRCPEVLQGAGGADPDGGDDRKASVPISGSACGREVVAVHSEASSQMVGDERKLVKLTTGRSEKITLPEWQRARDHLSMVIRSVLPLRDKGSLLSALAVQTCGRRERLLREATRALRGLLHT